MVVNILETLGGGRCPVAAPCLALGKIKNADATKHNRDIIDAERRRLADHITANYTEERWVNDVPWNLRLREYDENTTSYAQLQDRLVHGTPTTWLSPGYLVPLSDLYNMGVFLIVDAINDLGIEYHHIRSPARLGRSPLCCTFR